MKNIIEPTAISLTLPSRLRAQLKAQADKEGITESEILAHYVGKMFQRDDMAARRDARKVVISSAAHSRLLAAAADLDVPPSSLATHAVAAMLDKRDSGAVTLARA
jgi:hypothetical protein